MKSKNVLPKENNEKDEQEAFVKHAKRKFTMATVGGLISGGFFFLGLLMAITGDLSKTETAISVASIVSGWVGASIGGILASEAHETLEELDSEEEQETELQ